MNIEKIKSIPIVSYLEHIGHAYVERNGHVYSCASIVRPGADNPRHLVVTGGLWHDVVSGKGGSIIDLVMAHRQLDYISACRWLEEFGQLGRSGVKWNSLSSNRPILHSDGIEVVSSEPLHRAMWLEYVRSRCISPSLACNYLSEVQYRVRTHENGLFWGLGWSTRVGGWCIRNKQRNYNKLSTAPADISVIEGQDSMTLCIFEGMFDFLSFLTIAKRRQPPCSVIVLNSTSHIGKAMQLMEAYQQIRLYFDNDAAGDAATAAVMTVRPDAIDCRCAYADFNDINDMLISMT